MDVHAFCSDLNRLVMDYLVIEGYKTAAEEFSKEANLAPPIDLESIETRMSIREAVQRGEVEEAIAKVNDLDAGVSPRRYSYFKSTHAWRQAPYD